jgi:hypothetical protein
MKHGNCWYGIHTGYVPLRSVHSSLLIADCHKVDSFEPICYSVEEMTCGVEDRMHLGRLCSPHSNPSEVTMDNSLHSDTPPVERRSVSGGAIDVNCK